MSDAFAESWLQQPAHGWMPNFSCETSNVSYDHRVDDPTRYNFCAVPDSSYDAVFFIAVAVLVAVAASAKMSALNVLLVGALCQCLAYRYNLGRFGNAISLWLGLQPAEVFFYVFLPPLLLDSTISIDYFIFKKVLLLSLTFAFAIVIIVTMASIPILLFGLGLGAQGWTWVHVALFSSMIASTDAVAVSATLKAGGAPELISALLEGESLFNDASGLVLFQIFLRKLVEQEAKLGVAYRTFGKAAGITSDMDGISTAYVPPTSSAGSMAPQLSDPSLPGWNDAAGAVGYTLPGWANEILQVCHEFAWLAGGGLIIGLFFGMLTTQILRWLQWRRVKPYVEVACIFGGSYFVYFVANAYLESSGVIAVVCYALHGASTMTWHMSIKCKREGWMVQFWSVLCFTANGIIFFYVGISSTNFLIRLSVALDEDHYALLWSIGATLPMIYLVFTLMRWMLISAFTPLIRYMSGSDIILTRQGIIFATMGGLRGSISLILAQTVLAMQSDAEGESKKSVRIASEMGLYTTGYVLMTLLINGPLLTPLMSWLKLNTISSVQKQIHHKSKIAMLQYTETVIEDLRGQGTEMMRGVDWAAVEAYVDLRQMLDQVLPESRKEVKEREAREEEEEREPETDRVLDNGEPEADRGMEGGGLEEPLLGSEDQAQETAPSGLEKGAAWLQHQMSGDDCLPGSAQEGSSRPGELSRSSTFGQLLEASEPMPSMGSLDGVGRTPTRSPQPPSAGSSRSGARLLAGIGAGLGVGGRERKEDKEEGGEAKSFDEKHNFSFAPKRGAEALAAHAKIPSASSSSEATPVVWGFASSSSMDRRALAHPSSGGPPAVGGLSRALVSPRKEPPARTPSAASLQGAGPSSCRASREGKMGSGFGAAAVGRSGAAAAAAVVSLMSPQPSPLPPPPTSTSGVSGSSAARRAEALRLDSDYAAMLSDGQYGSCYFLGRPTPPPALARAGSGAALEAGGHRRLQRWESLNLSPTSEPLPASPAHFLQRTSLQELPARPLQRSSSAASRTTPPPQLSPRTSLSSGAAAPLTPQPHVVVRIAPEATAGELLGGEAAGDISFDADTATAVQVVPRSPSRVSGDDGNDDRDDDDDDDAALSAFLTHVDAAEEVRRKPQKVTTLTPSSASTAGITRIVEEDHGEGEEDPQVLLLLKQQQQQQSHDGGAASAASPFDALSPVCLSRSSTFSRQRGVVIQGTTAKAVAKAPSSSGELPHVASARDGQARKPPASRLPRSSTTAGRHSQVRMDPMMALFAGRRLTGSKSTACQPSGSGGGGTGAGSTHPWQAALSSNQGRMDAQHSQMFKRANVAVMPSLALAQTDGACEPSPRLGAQAGGAQAAQFAKDVLDIGKTKCVSKSSWRHGKEEGDDDCCSMGHDEAVSEYRGRLMSGLKRYFHTKHEEGLLSNHGMRILDYCCGVAADQPDKPIDLWSSVEEEVSGHGWVAWVHFSLRKTALRLDKGPWWPFRNTACSLLRFAAAVLARYLSRVMMVGLEVALELWQALTISPQAQWLKYAGDMGALLQGELNVQADLAWRFIIDREIEAPDRFQAIQSHRAAMAVLRKQQGFVQQLFEAGMIDEHEVEGLTGPIERRMWNLERRGPRWKQPSLTQVLANVPFLMDVPDEARAFFRSYGRLERYSQGETITTDGTARGLFVVVQGMVRIELTTELEADQQVLDEEEQHADVFYIGTGGVGGLTRSLLGGNLTGSRVRVSYYAEANALGKGPVLFLVPQECVDRLSEEVAAGSEELRELQLSMFRLAGQLLLERQQRSTVGGIVQLLLSTVHASEQALGPRKRCKLRLVLDTPLGTGTAGGGGGGRPRRGAGIAEQMRQCIMNSVFDASAPTARARRRRRHRHKANGSVVSGSGSGSSRVGSGDEASQGSSSVLSGRRRSSMSGSSYGSVIGEEEETRLTQRCVERALNIFETMKATFKEGELVTLEPGQVIVQRSTMILMRGSLIQKRVNLQHASRLPEQQRGAEEGCATAPGYALPVFRPPSLLLWLPDFLDLAVAQFFKLGEAVVYIAGPNGATVLACDADSFGTGDSDGVGGIRVYKAPSAVSASMWKSAVAVAAASASAAGETPGQAAGRSKRHSVDASLIQAGEGRLVNRAALRRSADGDVGLGFASGIGRLPSTSMHFSQDM